MLGVGDTGEVGKHGTCMHGVKSRVEITHGPLLSLGPMNRANPISLNINLLLLGISKIVLILVCLIVMCLSLYYIRHRIHLLCIILSHLPNPYLHVLCFLVLGCSYVIS